MASEPIAEAAPKHSYAQILKSTTLIGVSSLATIVMGVVRMKVMALLLGPAGVGLVGIFISIADLASSIAGAGVNGSGVRQVAAAAGTGRTRRVQVTAKVLARLSLILAVLGAVGLAAVAVPVSEVSFGNAGYAVSVALIGIAVFLRVVSAGQAALIQGMRKIGDFARMNVFVAVAGTVLSLPFVYFLREEGIALFLVAFAAVMLLGSWWYSRKLVEPVRVGALRFRQESKALLSLGFAFLTSALLTMAAGYIVRVLVLHADGSVAAGYYQAAWTIGGFYASFVLQAMGMDFYPRLTAVSTDNVSCNRLVNEQTEIGILIAGPGVMATLTLAPLVMDVLYSAEFHAASSVLRWICLGMMLRVVSWPMGFIILAKGNQRAFLITEIAVAIVHLGLAVLLVPRLGVDGAGLAFFGLYLCHTLIVLFVVRRLSGFAWTRVNLILAGVFIPTALLLTLAFLLLPFWLATALGSVATSVTGVGALVALVKLVPLEAMPRRLRPAGAEGARVGLVARGAAIAAPEPVSQATKKAPCGASFAESAAGGLRRQKRLCSEQRQVGRRDLAVATLLELVAHLLAFSEAGEARALDCRDVHECVLRAVIGLNEAEALGGVEELDGAFDHDGPLSIAVRGIFPLCTRSSAGDMPTGSKRSQYRGWPEGAGKPLGRAALDDSET